MLGNNLSHRLSWADHVNYTVKKSWKALHFIMRILKKGNSGTKSLTYTKLVRPILEYGAACWDPYRAGQIHALNRVQKKRLNLRIICANRTGKHCRSVERYHVYVLSSKRTLVNERGRL